MSDDIPRRYTFSDGVTASHNGSPQGVEMMRAMIDGDKRYQRNGALCAGWLRAHGVKLAHPDDGWVDRQRFSIWPAYPLFDDGVEEGDLIALGSPTSDEKILGAFRLVTVIGSERGVLGDRRRYFFARDREAKMIVPPCEIEFDPCANKWKARECKSQESSWRRFWRSLSSAG